MKKERVEKKYLPRHFVLILLVFTICVILGSIWFYSDQKRRIITSKQTELETVASLKIREILQWRRERLGDGITTSENGILKEKIKDYLKNPDSRQKEDFKVLFRSFTKNYDYQGVMLLDRSFKVRIAFPDNDTVVGAPLKANLARWSNFRNVFLSDLHRSQDTGPAHMDMIVPLSNDNPGDTSVYGFIVFQLDPAREFFPLIQQWPGSDLTAETLIVRKDGDTVVFLNELRHRTNTFLNLRFHVSQSDLPAAMAVMGYEGTCQGIDYRGIPVIAYVTAIPGTGWYMISKIDKAEVYKPLYYQTVVIIIITILLFFAAGALTAYLWRSQTAKDYKSRLILEEQKRRVETDLARQYWILKGLNDSSPAPIFSVDKSYCYTSYNTAHAETMKAIYNADIEIGKSILEYMTIEQDRIKAKVNFDRAFKGKRIVEEAYSGDEDNARLFFEVAHNPIIDDSNEVIGVAVIVRDLTMRKQMEEELWSLSSRNEAILSSIPNIIMEVDLNKIYTWTNQAGLEFFGDDVVGREASSYFDDEKDIYNIVDPLFNGETEKIYVETHQRRKDGEIRLLAWWCRSVKDKNDRVVGALSSAIDITTRKELELRILNLNQELEERVKIRTEELEAAIKELEAFSYSVSHDLRAPLRAIHSFTSILREEYADSLDSEGKRFCKIIESGTVKMGELIDDLLAFSRAGRTELFISKTDFNQIINSVCQELIVDPGRNNILIDVQKLPPAYCDPSTFKHVWSNLISNAIKYSSKSDRQEVVIGSNKEKSNVVYFIKDNGVGFDMRYYDKLFNVFQRLHNQKEFEGNGVGLAIVHRIISRHGGKVWAEAVEGEGAIFYFSLPEKREIDKKDQKSELITANLNNNTKLT